MNKSFLYKFLFLIGFFIIIFIHPRLIIMSSTLFIIEYIYFGQYIYTIYTYKTYYIWDVKEIDVSSCSNIDLFIEYSKLVAFRRLYLFCYKKNLKWLIR